MEKWIRAHFQPGLPLGSDGRRVTAGKEHIALSRRAAREGMVLLKNENNALPLPAGCRIALFGKATFDYVKGGGGSGDVQSQMTDSGIWIMKIMSPEKKQSKSWPLSKKETRTPLRNKGIRVSGYHSHSLLPN